MTPPERLAYRVEEAAQLLHISPRKAWELVGTGDLPSIKIGKARRVTHSTLLEYLQRLEAEEC